MLNLPQYVSIGFTLTTLLSLVFFYIAMQKATPKSGRINLILALIGLWMVFQAVLAFNGFYLKGLDTLPPRFLLAVFPPLLTIIIVFVLPAGRRFVDGLALTPLTYLHVVRIPVELILYALFVNQAIPEIMTFAGRNFDILAGISAPLIAYFGLQQQKISRRIMLVWHVLALALLLNIVTIAVLSLPTPFQQFGLDQPNWGVLHFPFNWLPAVVVPLVLFAHLVAIRRLIR